MYNVNQDTLINNKEKILFVHTCCDLDKYYSCWTLISTICLYDKSIIQDRFVILANSTCQGHSMGIAYKILPYTQMIFFP